MTPQCSLCSSLIFFAVSPNILKMAKLDGSLFEVVDTAQLHQENITGEVPYNVTDTRKIRSLRDVYCPCPEFLNGDITMPQVGSHTRTQTKLTLECGFNVSLITSPSLSLTRPLSSTFPLSTRAVRHPPPLWCTVCTCPPCSCSPLKKSVRPPLRVFLSF